MMQHKDIHNIEETLCEYTNIEHICFYFIFYSFTFVIQLA